MPKLIAARSLLPLLIAFLIPLIPTQAQPTNAAKPTDELYKTIAALDRELFDAYNKCDLETTARLFADNVEFYHDQGGVTVGTKTLLEQLKANICGKVRREILPETVQVYPMKGFGAIQMGSHQFYQPAVDAKNPVGEAKFFHLWQLKDGAWKLVRVVSYDHVGLRK